MPRRRPGAFRATQYTAGAAVRQWTGEGDGPIDRLSLGTTAVVRAVEHGSCRYDDVAVVRDGLEAVVFLLPSPARTELRRLLSRLDDEFRRRALRDSSPRRTWDDEPLPWWPRRIYRN